MKDEIPNRYLTVRSNHFSRLFPTPFGPKKKKKKYELPTV